MERQLPIVVYYYTAEHERSSFRKQGGRLQIEGPCGIRKGLLFFTSHFPDYQSLFLGFQAVGLDLAVEVAALQADGVGRL